MRKQKHRGYLEMWKTERGFLRVSGLQGNSGGARGMRKLLPHKGPRSRGSKKRSTGRSAADPKKCQVQPPEIFVRSEESRWSTHKYIAAQIRLRRGCYRYLCWRDGLLKREFYLGKIKILAPRFSRAAPAASPDQTCARDLVSWRQKLSATAAFSTGSRPRHLALPS